jgi:hypothetical protein
MTSGNRLISLILILAFTLSGCAVSSFKGDVESLSPETATVIGRVQAFRDDERQTLSFLGGSNFFLIVRDVSSGEVIQYGLNDPGFFFWEVPPGEYMILGFIGLGVGHGIIRAQFEVPAEAKALYIGDLIINVRGNDNSYSVALEDKPVASSEAFGKKFGSLQGEPERAIAQFEDILAPKKRVIPICSDYWGAECTDWVAGLEPIYPPVDQNAKVESLLPTFTWKSPSQPDVAYDIVIYKEQKIPRNYFGVVQDSLPGERVLYLQGLKRPTVTLTSPLELAHSYFWSVRLRRDSVVSTWSTVGYVDATDVLRSGLVHILAGLVKGTGRLFQFSTPARY